MIEIALKDVNCNPDEGEGFSGLTADLTGMRLVGIVAEPEESAILLLRILAGLHKPAGGEVHYNGSSFYDLSDEARSKLIRKNSYVFDTGGLISNLSVLENISLPYDFVNKDHPEEQKMSELKRLITKFNLDEGILQKRPSMLNKSEVKLINYLRAFLVDPDVVFIELPLARMSKTNEKILDELILERAHGNGKTHIFATQRNLKLVEKADAIIAIKKGEAVFHPVEGAEKRAFDYYGFFERQETS